MIQTRPAAYWKTPIAAQICHLNEYSVYIFDGHRLFFGV